jgi:hypothetical protein
MYRAGWRLGERRSPASGSIRNPTDALTTNPSLEVLVIDGNLEPCNMLIQTAGSHGTRLAERITHLPAFFGEALRGDAARLARTLRERSTTTQPTVQPPESLEPPAQTPIPESNDRRPRGRVTAQESDQILLRGRFGSIATDGTSIFALQKNQRDKWELCRIDSDTCLSQKVCEGFYDPRGLAITNDTILLLDATVWGRMMGVGGIWQINKHTGRRTLLIGQPSLTFGALRELVRSRRGQKTDLRISYLAWPTAITAYNDQVLITESRRIIRLDPVSAQFTPVTRSCFLNLNGIAHWNDGQYVVIEHVLGAHRLDGAQVGTLWMIDIASDAPPRCIGGNFTNAKGVRVHGGHAYVGDLHDEGWHLDRVDLHTGERQTLPGVYSGKPSFAIFGDRLLLATSDALLLLDLLNP